MNYFTPDHNLTQRQSLYCDECGWLLSECNCKHHCHNCDRELDYEPDEKDCPACREEDAEEIELKIFENNN